MSELPQGWLETTLGTAIDYGTTRKAEPEEIPDDAWILELEDVEKDVSKIIGRLTFGERKSKSTKNRFVKGDVLYGKLRPYLNKVVIADADGFCTTEIIPIKLTEATENRYVFYWLKHPRFLDYVTEVSHGLNMPRLGTEAGKNAPFVLAPVAEQKRIADKLDVLLGRVDASRARLDRIPPLLKRFRQSVLAAATSGQLTEDWRQAQSTQVAAVPVTPIHHGSDTNQPPPKGQVKATGECSESQAEPNLHLAQWQTSTLGSCGHVSGGLTKNTKRESHSLRKPYLRVANVHANRLELTDVFDIGLTESEYLKTKLINGDLLIVEGNGSLEHLGRVALWSGELDDCVHQNHLIRWRTEGPLPQWVLFWLLSPRGRNYLMDLASTTTGLHTLSISKVSAVPIELPSMEEQKEIVRRVEVLFALADKLEARYSTARTQVDKLTPALLTKAFRGELVPQDPNDEPADLLLARIRTAREAAPASVKKSRQPDRVKERV